MPTSQLHPPEEFSAFSRPQFGVQQVWLADADAGLNLGRVFFAVEEMLRKRLLGMMIPSLWTQSHPENGRGTINTMGFGGAWTPLAHHLRNMTGCQGYSYYRYYLPAG